MNHPITGSGINATKYDWPQQFVQYIADSRYCLFLTDNASVQLVKIGTNFYPFSIASHHITHDPRDKLTFHWWPSATPSSLACVSCNCAPCSQNAFSAMIHTSEPHVNLKFHHMIVHTYQLSQRPLISNLVIRECWVNNPEKVCFIVIIWHYHWFNHLM